MAKPKVKYWAGFVDGHIAETLEYYGADNDRVAAIYLHRKDARKHYQDVRKVEIKETKRAVKIDVIDKKRKKAAEKKKKKRKL